MGPISNIGPKTSRAARDRPELNLEAKLSRHNNLPEIVAGRRPHGGGRRHHVACGAWPHACRILCGAWRWLRQPVAQCFSPGRPPEAHGRANLSPSVAQPARKSAARVAQQLRNSGRQARSCAASEQVPRAHMRVGVSRGVTSLATGAWLQPESQRDWLFTVGGGRLRLIKSTTGSKVPSSACTRRPDEISTDGNSSKS
ncbi:hypothetical protein F511_25963 [Dorcoceras hygrometricum]|uniref:Uncharacterized protein n=1 Tax=Dorcoceras hygrometricum TaxID=472368 RepID=A0A2Z7ABM0_9LAMI|nr:hypothetical protein F511_25963 [Dorcoceras hygrometricum]